MTAYVVDDYEDSDYGTGAPIWWARCLDHQTTFMADVRERRSDAVADANRHNRRHHSGGAA